jgi:hypothetical protein
MSNLLQPMPVVQCKEVLLDFVEPKYCAKLPTNLKSFQVNQTQNVSNSSVQAKLEISNTAQVVDRNIIYRQPITVEITGNSNSDQVGLLQENCWSLRSNALAKIIQTINIQYGNSSYSFSSSDVISMMERYNTEDDSKYTEDYQQVMTDQTQEYDNLVGTNRNPLGTYALGTDTQYHRGTQPFYAPAGDNYFPFGSEGSSAPVGASSKTILLNIRTRAVFRMDLEALLLSSPLLDKLCIGGGSYGLSHLNNININITFVSNLGARLFSFVKNTNGQNGGPLTISSINVTMGTSPTFKFEQISDKEPIPRLLSYPLNTIERYPFIMPKTPYGKPIVAQSQVIQLSRIPSWCMFGLRPSNAVYENGVQVGDNPDPLLDYHGSQIADAFCALNNFTINFDGQTLFSNSSPSTIYKMCKEAKINDDYQSWAGYAKISGYVPQNIYVEPLPVPPNPPVVSYVNYAPKYVNGVGSVTKLVFGRDISLLKENLATGVNYRTNFQVLANYTNINRVVTDWTMYVILCYDDIIQIFDDNNANICSAPLTQNDVLSASPENRVHYDSLRNHNISGGSSMLHGLGGIMTHAGKKHYKLREMMEKMPHAMEAVKSSVGSGGSIATRAGMKKSLVNRD